MVAILEIALWLLYLMFLDKNLCNQHMSCTQCLHERCWTTAVRTVWWITTSEDQRNFLIHPGSNVGVGGREVGAWENRGVGGWREKGRKGWEVEVLREWNHLFSIKISKTRTQNVVWLTLTLPVFWDFQTNRKTKIRHWAEKLQPTSSQIRNPFTVVKPQVMKWPPLSCQKMWVKGARLKPKRKRKWKDCTSKWQGCVKFGVSLFTGDKSKTHEGGSWEKKGTGSRRFWPLLPPSQTCFNMKTTNCANASLHKKTQQTRVYMPGKYDWCFFLVGRQFMLHFLGCTSTCIAKICIFAVLNFSYVKKLTYLAIFHLYLLFQKNLRNYDIVSLVILKEFIAV